MASRICDTIAALTATDTGPAGDDVIVDSMKASAAIALRLAASYAVPIASLVSAAPVPSEPKGIWRRPQPKAMVPAAIPARGTSRMATVPSTIDTTSLSRSRRGRGTGRTSR